MVKLTADLVGTYKHHRLFMQMGGARPGNVVRYQGQDAQYMALDGVSAPESGGIDPIWVQDPRRPGKYKLVGRSITPPDLDEATLVLYEKHGSIPWQLLRTGCPFSVYEVVGKCKDLSDFVQGWSDYVLIYSEGLKTDKDFGTRTSHDSDDAIEDSLTVTWADIYPVGSLSFGEEAASEIEAEIVDLVYGTNVRCGDCGIENDGSNVIYAVTKAYSSGSPGLQAEVIYTTDAGGTWTDVLIDGLGATEEPLAIDIVGRYLVVVGLDAYYYAELDEDTGVPGTFTQVTSGFEASGSPNDLYVLSSREVFFCGDGGYIYKSTNITAGVSVLDAGSTTTEDYQRIAGDGEETLVLVSDNNVVVKSVNRGATFAQTVAAPSSTGTDDIRAVEVLDNRRFWVGVTETDGATVYYTLDGGKTWTAIGDIPTTGRSIEDIVFATNEVGFIAYATGAPVGYVLATWDGGENWTATAPRILNWPTLDRVNRVAVPIVASSGIAANNVALGGLAGNGTDGIVLVGIAGTI